MALSILLYFRGAVRDNGGAGFLLCWSVVPRLFAEEKIGKGTKSVAGQAFIFAHIITRRSLHELLLNNSY